MEDATPKSQSARGLDGMRGAAAPARPNKSAHVIDLRQSGGAARPSGGAARPAPKPHKPAAKPTAAPARSKLRLKPPALKKPAPAPVAAPKPEPQPEPELATPELELPAAAAAAVSSKPISASYLDAPPQRRFWSAFWRFLLLLVIFGVVLTGGLYIYLKYYT